MYDDRRLEDDVPWTQLSLREKALAAFGLAGLSLGVLTALLLALLALGLTVAVASSRLIETDGLMPWLWAALLLVPYSLVASLCLSPLRLLTRSARPSQRTAEALDAVASMASTFLGMLLTASFTPGLHVHAPWLPALLATLLIALANLLITRRSRGAQGSGR
ncbi:hypothetical protein [Streptomyces sp. PR69]|uniref:hypothetical protein n=1 Tax=Streptomyces sp. PR69 TaxID=2984950 RepID=UPI0022655FCC|nr:hypothetical protein [Streptomyces sp. PR69]